MIREKEALYRLAVSAKRYDILHEDIHTMSTLIKDYEREHKLRIRYENIKYEILSKLDEILKVINNLLQDKEEK